MSSGVWSSIFAWPIIGVHAIVLPDGRVLTFGTGIDGQQGALHYFDVWDPVTKVHKTLEHHVHTDIFCSAAVIVPQTGEILIAGGDTRPLATPNNGVADTNSFDYRTDELSISPTGDMAFARWYPTEIVLGNGKVLVLGGRDGNGKGVGTPELYTPGTGWSTLSGAESPVLATGWFYPESWVASDGRVVAVCAPVQNNARAKILTLDPSGNGRILSVTDAPFVKPYETPAIMFDRDKSLILASDNSAWIMDISAGIPKFTKASAPAGGHLWASMSLLADGSVLLTGGSAKANELVNPTYQAAIWNPNTNTWTYDASAAVARLYHSNTLLLPDATVLSVGGGAPGPLKNMNGEVYKPGYLFNADGSPATRPVITDAPHELEQRQEFTVSVDTPSAITKLTLVKNGAATHSSTPESRIINLEFHLGADNKLHVTLPPNANVLTPGTWMLFAFNAQGTPSVASMVNIATGGELWVDAAKSFATLSGSASFDTVTKTFTLTPDMAFTAGIVNSNKAIDLNHDFAITASVNFGAKDAGLGGITFVLHNDPLTSDAIGYSAGHMGAGGINNGLAIEFDTANHGAAFNDIAADHTQIFDTDAAMNKRQVTAPVALGQLEDNRWHTLQFEWNAQTQTLSYKIDGTVVGTLTADIAAKFLGGSTNAYFAFTAGTGANGNLQQLRIQSVDATLVTPPLPVQDTASHDGTPHTFDLDHIADCMTLAGGARFSSSTNIIKLTADAPKKVAAAMSDVRFDVTQNFDFAFDAFLGTKMAAGEGLAFVIHNDPVGGNAIGWGGGALGAEGIRKGLALEFDTNFNGTAAGDLQSNHIQLVDTDAGLPSKYVNAATVVSSMEDGFWHSVRISWNAEQKVLSYSFDGKTIGTIYKDLSAQYLGGSKYAYFGFTGSTGDLGQLQQVRLTQVDAAFNEADCDNDHVHGPALKILGNAAYDRVGGAIQLTPDKPLKVGGAMSEQRIDLTADFDLRFDIFLGKTEQSGAGVAFVMHADPGGNGQLGYAGANFGATGIKNGLAIEFDVFDNGPIHGDLVADHTNFIDTDLPFATRNLTAARSLGNIEDAYWHSVRVHWDAAAQRLSYSFDGKDMDAITGDLAQQYFAGSDSVYFGVTGSTGANGAQQFVRFAYTDAVFV